MESLGRECNDEAVFRSLGAWRGAKGNLRLGEKGQRCRWLEGGWSGARGAQLAAEPELRSKRLSLHGRRSWALLPWTAQAIDGTEDVSEST